MKQFFYKVEKLISALLLFILIFLFPAFIEGQDASAELESEYSDDELFFEDAKGITVVGTPQTSQQMAVIEKAEIEKHNAADLAVLLQETLNLGVTRYGGYGNMTSINLRGFDSKRTAFLENGAPLNSAMNSQVDIEQIDLNSIERTEVIYGGSDSKYNVSGALGGVINIITVKKQKAGLSIGGSVSNTSALPGKYRGRNGVNQNPHWEDLLDTQNYGLRAAYGGGNFSLSANAFANRAENHFLFTDDMKMTRRKDNNEVWDTGARTSLVWQFPSLAELIASSSIYYGDKNIPTSGFSENAGKQQDIAARHNVIFDAPRAFHDDLASEAALTYNFIDRKFTDVSSAKSRHDLHDIMAVNRWSWYPAERLTLRSGIDYRFIYLDSTEIGNRGRHDGGIYLTAEFKPHNRFLVIPSIKAVITSGGEGKITPVPKLGLLWTINDSVALKNNYFRSFKFPDFEDLYWTQAGYYGNPNLRPEDGWGTDLGVEWKKKLFKLESVFYTQWTEDSIHWSNLSGTWRPENVGAAIFFGFDNKLRFEIPVSVGSIKTLVPSVSYQHLSSYLLSYGYNFSSNKRIPYMPVHAAGASLDILWETGSLLISAHYESQRYADPANLTQLQPHFLLNMAANQKIGKNITAQAALRNMLNQNYESFDDYYMPGISLTLGIKAQFDIN